MTKNITDISQRKAAIFAGLGLLIMTILAIFANFFVFQKLIIPGNAAATAGNITANGMLFRIGIFSFLIVIVMDVVAAWALYVFLKPVNRSLSLLASWFRLVYSAIFAVALINYYNIFQILSNAEYLKAFTNDQIHAKVLLSINAFNDGWNIGFVFFGIHLALIGYLVFISGYMPRILGVLLAAAGLGYLVDSLGKILFSNYNFTIAMFTFIGELLLMFWLLIKGSRIKE